MRTGYDSSRVPMKYTFSTSKWIRKLIFDGHPVRWFGLVFQFSARRRRRRRCRDVIVKYDYSVSRRLFLTPGSSPSFSQPSGDRRTIDRYRVDPITTLKQRYRSIRRVDWNIRREQFFHDEIFTSRGLFPQFSTCFRTRSWISCFYDQQQT